MRELTEATLALLGMARKSNVEWAEAWIRRRQIYRCQSDRAQVTSRRQLDASLRIRLSDGREGLATSNLSNLQGASSLVAEAVANSMVPDKSVGSAPRLDIRTMGMGTLDRRQAHLDDDARMEVVKSNHQAMSDVGKEVVPVRVSYLEELSEISFASTHGLEAEDRSTRFALSAEGHVRENLGQRVQMGVQCRTFADACTRPLGAEVGRKIRAMTVLGERPSERVPVVFSQTAAAHLLPQLIPAFENSRIESGNSFLSNRMGQAQGSSLVHVIDDASVPGGLQTRVVDSRGIPPVPVPLWVEGVPTGRYLGVQAAVEQGLRPSGHVGFDNGLWPGNLVVRPGSRSRNMLFPELGPLVICEELLDCKVNLATGSLKLKLRCFTGGYEMEPAYIGDLTMKTDVDSLLSSVIHMASDQERIDFVDTPSWILDGPWFE